jgi:hypothetical protein
MPLDAGFGWVLHVAQDARELRTAREICMPEAAASATNQVREEGVVVT